LTSISSTSSTSSFSRIKRAFQKGTRSSYEVGQGEFVMKGSSKTFRKEDIKLGGLTNSTVYFHAVWFWMALERGFGLGVGIRWMALVNMAMELFDRQGIGITCIVRSYVWVDEYIDFLHHCLSEVFSSW
jgi:hypothetical protein